MTLRLLLADDHTLFRAGFRALLEKLGGYQVVAEAADGREALRLIELHLPNIVLMDITMPELNGLEVTARVKKQFPSVRVILISMHSNETYAREAVRVGAAGYLLKGASTAELELAIKAVANGETYLSPAIAKHVLADYARHVQSDGSLYERLTPRQREILQLIAEGHTRKKIAERLGISPKTFDTFRAQLLRKLDLQDNVGLIACAVEWGLVSANQTPT
jgi:DNA-binding NarL/FixJ family response regulator